jgi:acetylornithine deacetylase/succinyl-diaminopimelate desuccinylase-like protein
MTRRVHAYTAAVNSFGTSLTVALVTALATTATVVGQQRATTGAPLASAASVDAGVARVLASAPFKQAATILDRDHDKMVADIVTLTEIPSPPFKEDKRGEAVLAMFRQTKLTNIERDSEGNVLGLRKGTGGGPLIAIAAHLDTVFPEGTNVKVTRTGTRLAAPGVGDDTRSLAVLVAIIRAMDEANVQTKADILFVADVGEEGPGDLRGMKQLFIKGPYKDHIKNFISIDGSGEGNAITYGAVGSKRYHVTFKGPGGHSYGAFGLVSPSFAMGNAIEKFSHTIVPQTPKTTFNVGVMGGGTSVNSIPNEVWMDVDMRSEARDELNTIDRSFAALVAKAVAEENAARSTSAGKITVDLKLIGDRPSGHTPMDSALVQTASAVVRALGMTPDLGFSSTDANIPISLGIPAITIDSGGTGGRAHALDEWIDVEKTKSLQGMRGALALLLTLAG